MRRFVVTPALICRFHATRVLFPEYHRAFALYQDNAGVEPMCKDSLDIRLDCADEDPELEPKGIWIIEDVAS